MTEKEKELLNALKIIKKTCMEHDCNDCPCSLNGGICMVHNAFPNHWNLVEEQPAWKAFNN